MGPVFSIHSSHVRRNALSIPAIGDSPPEVSPSMVAYPTAASERLEVATRIFFSTLAMSQMPGLRTRAWMFWSAMSSLSQVS